MLSRSRSQAFHLSLHVPMQFHRAKRRAKDRSFQSPPPADRISSSPLSKAWGGVSRFLVHAQPIFKIIVTVQELKRVEGGCVAFDVGSSAREFQKSLAILESAFSLEPFCERSPVRANVVYPDFNFLWQNNFGLADSNSQMRFSNGI